MKTPSMTSTLLLAAAVVACCWFLPGAEAGQLKSSIAVEDPSFVPVLFDDGDVIPPVVNKDHAGLQNIWTFKRSSTDCAALLAQLNQEHKNVAFTVGPRSVLPLEKSAELKKRLEIVENLVAAGCPALVVF